MSVRRQKNGEEIHSEFEEVILIVDTFVQILNNSTEFEHNFIDPFLKSVGEITARYVREYYPDIKIIIHHLGMNGRVTVVLEGENDQITSYYPCGSEIDNPENYTDFSTLKHSNQ